MCECGWSWPFCEVDGHHSGHKNVAIIEGVAVVERWPQNRGLLSTFLNGDGHYREGGHLSGVAVTSTRRLLFQ